MKGSVGTSSGLLAAGTTTITTLAAKVHSVQVVAAAATAIVTVYNDPSAATSGKEVAKLSTPTLDSNNVHFPEGISCERGITVVVSGVGAGAIITYELSG